MAVCISQYTLAYQTIGTRKLVLERVVGSQGRCQSESVYV